MKLNYRIILILVVFSIMGCGSPRPIIIDAAPPEDDLDKVLTEQRDLDTLFVSAPRIVEKEEKKVPNTLPSYNGTYTRSNDLIHTKLDIRFNWDKEEVIGKAYLTFSPIFYSTRELILDAKNFDFDTISFVGKSEPLSYAYNDNQIIIDLGQSFSKNDTFEIFLDYTAHPTKSGGSNAITSDQGLFFINPKNEESNKPQQIWTQGETEWNSKWFPTIDKPNERCTQELSLTVSDKFVTLSNGALVNSTKNNDGTRTDLWKMDQPHAPYLFMVAVGEFAVVREEWEGVQLEYYVEPKYEASAKEIFAHTPEMLSFFSERLGIKYPWNKYSQIVVRDYVSGAMENTTAVIFGDFVQKHAQELIDNGNDEIVAHELFHHWFGDYVTCESWANLTMNEGFATYSEYLWYEYKYGQDEADFHLLNQADGYYSGANGSFHPLIHFGYRDKEDMFDAHSYNKGGAVLHMLRKYVGDEAFWASLNKYLVDNAYRAVEMHDLRLAFEAVTGEDLNWFFNQWFIEQGHPIIKLQYGYDEEENLAELTVTQIQEPESMAPIFKLPVLVDIYLKDGIAPIQKKIVVDQREQIFQFEVPSNPKAIVFDSERMLLAQILDDRNIDAHKFLYKNSSRFLDRFEAIQALSDSEVEGLETLKQAIKDPFWYIRGNALQNIDPIHIDDELKEVIKDLILNDPKSQIRGLALNKLSEVGDKEIVEISKKVIDQEKSYIVIAVAFNNLISIDQDAALEYAKKLEKIDNDNIISSLSNLYASTKEESYRGFFEENLLKIDGFNAMEFYSNYQVLVRDFEFETVLESMKNLEEIAINQNQSSWRKLAAARAINELRNHFREIANKSDMDQEKNQLEEYVQKISEIMDRIIDAETDSQLKEIYQTRLILIEKP